MEPSYTSSVDAVIRALQRLPGVGKRSAERMAMHLLKAPREEAEGLASAIVEMRRTTAYCSVCFNLTEEDPCAVCADPQRDPQRILVVEQPDDVTAIESTGQYKGLYHVLMGRLAPLEGVGPEQLNIDRLIQRVERGEPAPPNRPVTPASEVLLGLSPTMEGDGTALYLERRLRGTGTTVQRLGRGIPAGTSLDRLSKAVLADALASPQKVSGTDAD